MKLWLALNPITLLAYIDLQVKQKMNLRNLLKSLKLVWKIFNCKSPFLIVRLGDVKARSKGWYKYNIKIFEVWLMLILKFLKTNIAKSLFDLSQMINEPMNVLNNISSYNLIFTFQANSIACSSLQPNCHHHFFEV